MRTLSNDTDPKTQRVQRDLLRKATVAARAGIAFSLSELVIGLARTAIRRQNPEISDREVLLRFVAIHYGPELAEALRSHLGRRSE